MTHPNPRIAEIYRKLDAKEVPQQYACELWYLRNRLEEAEEALDKIATGFYATIKEDEEVSLAALANIRGGK